MVTGAGSGIGAAVARRLAADGHTVVLVDRDGAALASVADELATAGGVTVPACIDVSDAAALEHLVDTVVDRFGRLDHAVNNAGVTGVHARTADYPDDVFWRVQQVNVGGVFAGMRAQLRQMRRQGGGSVVNTASGAGFRGVAGSVAYVASKHAIVGLTRTAALEYAAEGIRVNAVAPGLVDTPLVAGVDHTGFAAAHPIGRSAVADEIAAAVCWLLGPEAGYLTGVLLPVDGGLSAAVPGLSS
jgi:NAD(P)-dependent dehydrogenase (short-subunit alcohol dehydrogenase family)